MFYAHTISPICIAFLCVIGMTGFVGSYHILPALVLLAGCLLVGIALPVWSAKRGDRVAREYRQALADTNSYVLEVFAACGTPCSTRIRRPAPRASTPTARRWAKSRRPSSTAKASRRPSPIPSSCSPSLRCWA